MITRELFGEVMVMRSRWWFVYVFSLMNIGRLIALGKTQYRQRERERERERERDRERERGEKRKRRREKLFTR